MLPDIKEKLEAYLKANLSTSRVGCARHLTNASR